MSILSDLDWQSPDDFAQWCASVKANPTDELSEELQRFIESPEAVQEELTEGAKGIRGRIRTIFYSKDLTETACKNAMQSVSVQFHRIINDAIQRNGKNSTRKINRFVTCVANMAAYAIALHDSKKLITLDDLAELNPLLSEENKETIELAAPIEEPPKGKPEKGKPQKLPPQKAPKTKDSSDAAAKAINEMFNRRR